MRAWSLCPAIAILAVPCLVLLALGTTIARGAANSTLLVARPTLADPNFRETVVLVTRHAHGGAVGVVLNRPTTTLLTQVFPDSKGLKARPDRLSTGGPVAPGTLVAVFRAKEMPRQSLAVLDGVYMSLDPALLRSLVGAAEVPRDLRVFSGQAAWAPGQLEVEIHRGAWYVLEPDAATIFRSDSTTLWRELVRRAESRSVRADRENDREQESRHCDPTLAGRRVTVRRTAQRTPMWVNHNAGASRANGAHCAVSSTG